MDGVLAAVLAALPANSGQGVQMAKVSSASVAVGAYRTELTITGSGYLHLIGWYVTNGGTAQKYVYPRVTIDGKTAHVVGDSSASDLESQAYGSDAYANMGRAVAVGKVRFRKSLKVEIRNGYTSAANICTATIYSLEA